MCDVMRDVIYDGQRRRVSVKWSAIEEYDGAFVYVGWRWSEVQASLAAIIS